MAGMTGTMKSEILCKKTKQGPVKSFHQTPDLNPFKI